MVDGHSGKTSLDGVYAGGDASRGGDMVVTAVAGENTVHMTSKQTTRLANTANCMCVCGASSDGKRAAAAMIPDTTVPERPQMDLSTEFCGITFPNPFCLSSSPVSNTKDMCARAFDAGFGGRANHMAKSHAVT